MHTLCLWRFFSFFSGGKKYSGWSKKQAWKWGFIQKNYHISPVTLLCFFFYCMNINAFTQSTRQHTWYIWTPPSFCSSQMPAHFLLLLVFVWGYNSVMTTENVTKKGKAKKKTSKLKTAFIRMWICSLRFFPLFLSQSLKWCNDEIKQSSTGRKRTNFLVIFATNEE